MESSLGNDANNALFGGLDTLLEAAKFVELRDQLQEQLQHELKNDRNSEEKPAEKTIVKNGKNSSSSSSSPPPLIYSSPFKLPISPVKISPSPEKLFVSRCSVPEPPPLIPVSTNLLLTTPSCTTTTTTTSTMTISDDVVVNNNNNNNNNDNNKCYETTCFPLSVKTTINNINNNNNSIKNTFSYSDNTSSPSSSNCISNVSLLALTLSSSSDSHKSLPLNNRTSSFYKSTSSYSNNNNNNNNNNSSSNNNNIKNSCSFNHYQSTSAASAGQNVHFSSSKNSINEARKRVCNSGTREVHNKLEKNRRAHLKECFEFLKSQVPSTMDEKKTSNLTILRSAIRYIQLLKKRENELEFQMEQLSRRKLEKQDKLTNLKKELSSQWEHIDFDALLPDTADIDREKEMIPNDISMNIDCMKDNDEFNMDTNDGDDGDDDGLLGGISDTSSSQMKSTGGDTSYSCSTNSRSSNNSPPDSITTSCPSFSSNLQKSQFHFLTELKNSTNEQMQVLPPAALRMVAQSEPIALTLTSERCAENGLTQMTLRTGNSTFAILNEVVNKRSFQSEPPILTPSQIHLARMKCLARNGFKVSADNDGKFRETNSRLSPNGFTLTNKNLEPKIVPTLMKNTSQFQPIEIHATKFIEISNNPTNSSS